MMDRTFSGAIDDIVLRSVLADIKAGKIVVAKQKLVKFLAADPDNVTALEILGTLLLNDEKHEDAEKLLKRAVRIAPQQVSAKVRLGVVLLNQQKFAEAAPHLQFAVEREPDNILALTNYGWLLIEMGRDRDALAIYERLNTKAYETKVSKTDVFIGLSVLYYRLDLPEKSISLLKPQFDQTNKRHVNNRVFLNLFDAYLSRKKLTDAENVLKRLRDLLPEDHIGPTLSEARLLAAKNDSDRAVKVLTAALSKFPKSAGDIHTELGRIYFDKKYYRRAASSYSKAASVIPPDQRVDLLAEFSNRFTEAGRQKDTLALLEKFATLDGKDGRISLMLAETLSNTGDKTRALTLIDGLIARNPRFADAHFQKSVILRLQEKTKPAMDAMRAAVTHDPLNPVAWQLLADLSHDVHGDASMVGVLKEGLSHNPTDPRLLLGVGSLSYSEGNLYQAQEMFDRFVARYPNNAQALSNAALASLDLGEAPEKARELLKRAVDIAPRVPVIADTWGWMLHKLGNHKAAISLLLRVAKAIPNDGGVQYHLGVTYAASGNPGKGRAALRRALALGVPAHYKDDIVKRLTKKPK